MRPIRFLSALLLAGLLAGTAAAQSLFDAPADEAPAQAAETASEPDAARALAEILQDDAARAALIRQLLATAEQVPDSAEAEPEPEPSVSLAREIAEQTRGVAEGATGFARDVTGALGDVIGAVTTPEQIDWDELQSTATALALVVVVTLALFAGLRALGRRIFRAMSARANGGGWITQLARLIGSSVIDALIILIAWAGGYAFALAFGEAGGMDFRQSLFLNAFLLIEITKVLLRAIFAPNFGRLRFAPMSDETAAYWYFWASRLVSLLGYGILLIVPIVNATVSFAVGRSLTMLIVVTALIVAILVILQNRGHVARALRARNERDPSDLIGRLEAMLAAVWHWLAIGYLIALFVIWSAQPGDALQFMLRATLNSVFAVLAGVVAMVLISRVISGGLRLPEDMRRSMPLLEDRLNAFVPTVLKVIRGLVALAVVISIAQSWQLLDFLGWLASEVGRDTVSRLVSAAIVLLITALIWIGVSSVVEYRLNPEVGSVPTARERTLLALFRNAFLVALVIIAAMLTLSELGVNIAPLLAGAGVFGLAIGFGAQKLVQDIITGAFIQVENAMNEGDVVTAGGTTGVVERLTIRSVGLRDVSGTYHLIPFSSVDMVSNFMKGFAYHVAEVGVAYRENVAEVRELMHKADEILRASDLGSEILEPLDIQGVTELGDSAVVVRGRIKTRPGMQWAVGRAYNEIIKQVLDEAGVEIPFPHMTLYMGQDKEGSAPPLHLRHHGITDPAQQAGSGARAQSAPVTTSEASRNAPPSADEADSN